LLSVVEANCRYLSPARYDDDVAIRTEVGSANARLIRFDYEIACGDRPLATGFTRHVFLDRKFRAARLPARYHSLFAIESRSAPS
jgi:acyl-CoA thioester hydrolase